MRALVCQTQEMVPIGTLGGVLAASGVETTIWRADREAAPLSLDGFGAVIALGGAANPDEDDRYPWLEDERRLLRLALEGGLPTLGLCLGAQLLAQVGGGEVRRLGRPEIGWVTIRANAAGYRDPLYSTIAGDDSVFEWHAYGFTLPPRAQLLAGTPSAVQAFRLGARAWGLQFHLEASAAIVEGWISHYESDLRASGPAPSALSSGTRRYASAQERLARRFGHAFVDLASRAPAPPTPRSTAA